jgi:hypothetical protein
MAVYTIHAPASARASGAPTAENFVFVRDGFHGWAFLLGPLWILAHRLWLVLAGYIVVIVVLQATLMLIGKTAATPFAMFGVALLLGLEAGSLRRWTLRRNGARELGIVNADTQEAAERRFFDSWHSTQSATPAAGVTVHGHMPTPAAATGDVIGLFPQPGAPR